MLKVVKDGAFSWGSGTSLMEGEKTDLGKVMEERRLRLVQAGLKLSNDGSRCDVV